MSSDDGFYILGHSCLPHVETDMCASMCRCNIMVFSCLTYTLVDSNNVTNSSDIHQPPVAKCLSPHTALGMCTGLLTYFCIVLFFLCAGDKAAGPVVVCPLTLLICLSEFTMHRHCRMNRCSNEPLQCCIQTCCVALTLLVMHVFHLSVASISSFFCFAVTGLSLCLMAINDQIPG